MSSEIRWYDYAFALLPLFLVASIGALGLAIGPMGAAINLATMKKVKNRPVRIVLALVVAFVAFLFWSWLVVVLR